MNHDRDAEISSLREDRPGQLAVVDRPVLVHRVELDAGQAKLGDRPLELIGCGSRPAKSRVDRGEPDQVLRIGRHASGNVVVASLRIRWSGHAQLAAGVDGADQAAVEVLGGDRQDDDLIETRMIANRLGRSDQRPAAARVAAGGPFLLGRHPVRGQHPHAAVDAQRSLATVLHGKLRIGCEGENVTVGVDDHGAALPPLVRTARPAAG